MDNNASNLALIAILGTVITALFKLLAANTKALGKLVESNARIADEAKQRNGHLGDQSIQLAGLVKQGNEISTKILQEQKKTAVLLAETPTDQHVEHQTVENQVIKEK